MRLNIFELKYYSYFFLSLLFYFIFPFIFIVDIITGVPFLPPLPFPYQSLLPLTSGHHHAIVCVHRIYIHVYFSSNFPNPSPLTAVCSMYPCFCFYFVHQIPHISEIIWYLSFSDWHSSLNLTISRSIDVVVKGKISSLCMAT